MALNSINTNIGAYYAQANIAKASAAASSSISRLSSGNKIVQAKDDVAAMAAGTSLRTNVTTLKQALTNTSQGSSLLQVADGALSQMTDILQRQKALSVQASSGSLSATDRGFLNQEFQNLAQELDRIVGSTNFNGVNLLDGSLGTKSSLVATDTIAAAFSATTTTSIEAFDSTGAEMNDATAGAGNIQFVDSTGADLADGAFAGVNSAVSGSIGVFTLSNVSYSNTTANTTGAATISTTINGITFSGQIADQDDVALLSNGNTYLLVGLGTFDLTDSTTAGSSLTTVNTGFEGVSIQRTKTVDGVNYAGTALAGVTGNAAVGAPLLRTGSTNDVTVSNFRFVGGTSGANVLAVDIGGQTYTASAVADTIDAAVTLSFTGPGGQGLDIDLNGMTGTLTDINGNMSDRNAFISGLNQAFASAGSGIKFAVGSSSQDTLAISIRNASTNSLYGGATLSIATAAGATAASDVLDSALDKITSVRADVGALQSRFDFASANIQSSIQNQDAARGILLDTDVAAESTAFSQEQVQLQAGIAVLAQANQLPQNLLKLIQ